MTPPGNNAQAREGDSCYQYRLPWHRSYNTTGAAVLSSELNSATRMPCRVALETWGMGVLLAMFHGVPPIPANGDKVGDTLFSDRPRKDQNFGVVQATYGKDM